MSDIIKMRVDRSSPTDTKLFFYESRDGGEHWAHNGMLICDPEIAALFQDVFYRGQGRWGLIVERFENE